MHQIFNSLQDLYKYCDDALTGYECQFYGFENHDDFVDAVAKNFHDKNDFEWGQEMPNMTDEFFIENFVECFCCDKIKKFSGMSEQQKENFTKHFYEIADSRIYESEFGDGEECSSPWGCPWYWNENGIPKGDTIREMAENLWKEIKQEVTRILDEEENFAG